MRSRSHIVLLLAIFVSFSLFLFKTIQPKAQAQTVPTISASNESAASAQSQVVVTVDITDATNVGAFNTIVTYDPQVVQFGEAAIGDFLVSGTLLTDEDPPGTLAIGAYSLGSGSSTNGQTKTLYTMTFSVIGDQGSFSPIHFADANVTEASLVGTTTTANTNDGNITIGSTIVVTPTPLPSSSPLATPSPTLLPALTFLTANLSGSIEVPPNDSNAQGQAEMTYRSDHTFDINITVTGIGINEFTAAHIHESAPQTNGPIIFDLGPKSAWTETNGNLIRNITGATFPSDKESALLTGNTYVNVHTNKFPAGEIRGQLIISTTPSSPLPSPTPDNNQAACLAAGGTWETFPNSCVDSCEYASDPGLVCLQVLTEGCDCGPAKCWDWTQNTCVDNPPIIAPPPTSSPFPSSSPGIHASPSPQPDYVIIMTKLEGINRERAGDIFIEISIYQNGTAVIPKTAVRMRSNASGVFSSATSDPNRIGPLDSGEYSVYIDGPSHLTKRFDVTYNKNNPLNFIDAPIKTGDILDNDRVDPDDYNRILEHFGPRMPETGSTADLDLDDDVDIFDYSYLVGNFWLEGDKPEE